MRIEDKYRAWRDRRQRERDHEEAQEEDIRRDCERAEAIVHKLREELRKSMTKKQTKEELRQVLAEYDDIIAETGFGAISREEYEYVRALLQDADELPSNVVPFPSKETPHDPTYDS